MKNWFRRWRKDQDNGAAVPPGERIYAIGDIHGRLDLFTALLTAIEHDTAQRQPARTTIVLLGDLIDRGPDSAGVVAAARSLAERRVVRLIAGNHEEMLLAALSDPRVLNPFLRHGGLETLLSYPVDAMLLSTTQDLEPVRQDMQRAIPAEDIAFLEAAEDMVQIGDYLFVHAGIRPEVPLEEQSPQDLRWIREPFLSHPGEHGCVVVHGHTITDEAVIRPNRIGIDTGAYHSGCLTALALEGTARWLIQTSVGSNGRITCRTRSMT